MKLLIPRFTNDDFDDDLTHSHSLNIEHLRYIQSMLLFCFLGA